MILASCAFLPAVPHPTPIDAPTDQPSGPPTTVRDRSVGDSATGNGGKRRSMVVFALLLTLLFRLLNISFFGEALNGIVVLENSENIKIRGIRVVLRGKAHAQMKITKSGERRTVKDDQYLLDDKAVIWGKDKHEEDGHIPILPRGMHQFPFSFQLPQTALPCSLESKLGTIRYYIKVVIDIPYASSPQGIKYFTVIGPHIDCMEEKYLNSLVGQDRKTTCCLCCQRGSLALRLTLERTAYVCGENIRVHAQVENQSNQAITIKIKLIQFVEYFIDKGVLGESKALSCTVLEHKSPPIAQYSQGKYDSTLEQPIKLPVVPATLIGVCRLIQIYYVLKVCLEDEKSNESLPMDFPLTVATVPYRIPNSSMSMPPTEYDFCAEHVEGGKYISPEFRLGQVYDGGTGEPSVSVDDDHMLLYRPVYVRIADRDKPQATPRFSRDYSPAELPGTSAVRNKLNAADNGAAIVSKPTATYAVATTEVTVDLHQLNIKEQSKSASAPDDSQQTPPVSNKHKQPLLAEASSGLS
uniref:Arrestin C-terminal-like domain-containing protein n=1 Tax=Plectus sambesii TaxID=2011161 RepID=A0A914VSW8_9BILA